MQCTSTTSCWRWQITGTVRCEIDSRIYNRILETRRVGLYVLLLFLIYLFLQLHAVSCKIVSYFHTLRGNSTVQTVVAHVWSRCSTSGAARIVLQGGSEVWVYRRSRVRSPPVPVVLSVYQRGSLLDGLAMYLSCDTKKFHDNESTHILHNFWTSTHSGEASPLAALLCSAEERTDTQASVPVQRVSAWRQPACV